jgi:ParB-like chromosome segregation protein Spo0J
MKWNLEKRKIKDLFEYTKNPRTLTKDQQSQLQKSLETFGQCKPIVINTDNLIIGGHQTTRTLKKMGHKEVVVYVPEQTLTDREVEELNIRLNANGGSFDEDILANCYEVADLINWGYQGLPKDVFDNSSESEEDEHEKCSECGKKKKK